MPLAFGLIAAGALMAYSGLKGKTLLEAIRGLPGTASSHVYTADERSTEGAALRDAAPSGSGSSGSSGSSGGSGGTKNGGKTTLATNPIVSNIKNLPKGVGHFDGKPVALWIIPYLSWARKHGWSGSVTSGYRSYADQKRIYDSGVRPAAVPGSSNHEGSVFPRGAVDVSNATQLAQVLKKFPGPKLLVYAGSKDPVHFSHPHNGSY